MHQTLIFLFIFICFDPIKFGTHGFTTRLTSVKTSDKSYEIVIDGSRQHVPFKHFWKNTGFCPPQPHQRAEGWFLGPDMKQNLQYVGAVPHSGIQQVRIHWLLDLIRVKGIDNGQPVYDFSQLDALIHVLWKNHLKPGFEIMGNPSSFYTDLENKTQVFLWKDMVTQIAKHYIDRYGLDYVKAWNFETWNEPDHQKEYDDLKFNVHAFNNYYDACSEGLRAASAQLIFGGPGASCRDESFSKICWGLLDHIENGFNFFTGEKGIRVDFISFHKKGLPPENTRYILKSDLQTIARIHILHPRLARVPIFNDEADPLVGWSKSEWWRADATYAAMVVKAIAQHQYEIIARPGLGINYALLSNDNGFLSYQPSVFTQRTLLARFQINSTVPAHTQMVRKPVYNVMGLLAVLGDNQLALNITDGLSWLPPDGDVGAIATVYRPMGMEGDTDNWQVGVLVYNSRDTSTETGKAFVKVTFKNMNPPQHTEMKMVRYALDNLNGNPAAVWNSSGQPAAPNWKVFHEMRQNENPVRTFGPSSVTLTSDLSVTFTLPLPGVSLIHICARGVSSPYQPADLQVMNVTSGQVLLWWSDKLVKSKCLLTYEVEQSQKTPQGPYHRINSQDTIFTVFPYSPDPSPLPPGVDLDEAVRGFYRVRVIDYFGRASPYTEPVRY